jgi:hypothetical protein
MGCAKPPSAEECRQRLEGGKLGCAKPPSAEECGQRLESGKLGCAKPPSAEDTWLWREGKSWDTGDWLLPAVTGFVDVQSFWLFFRIFSQSGPLEGGPTVKKFEKTAKNLGVPAESSKQTFFVPTIFFHRAYFPSNVGTGSTRHLEFFVTFFGLISSFGTLFV